MKLINHGPAPIRIVTPEGSGPTYAAPVLLEAGQEWEPAPGQRSVSFVAAFGSAMVSLDLVEPA